MSKVNDFEFLSSKIEDIADEMSENQHKQLNLILDVLIRDNRLDATRDPASFDEKKIRCLSQIVKCRLDLDRYYHETEENMRKRISSLNEKELDLLTKKAKEAKNEKSI